MCTVHKLYTVDTSNISLLYCSPSVTWMMLSMCCSKLSVSPCCSGAECCGASTPMGSLWLLWRVSLCLRLLNFSSWWRELFPSAFNRNAVCMATKQDEMRSFKKLGHFDKKVAVLYSMCGPYLVPSLFSASRLRHSSHRSWQKSSHRTGSVALLYRGDSECNDEKWECYECLMNWWYLFYSGIQLLLINLHHTALLQQDLSFLFLQVLVDIVCHTTGLQNKPAFLPVPANVPLLQQVALMDKANRTQIEWD